MDIELLKSFLLWSAALNYGLLLFSFAVFVLGRGWMYRLHRRWFDLEHATLDALLYLWFGLYKLAIVFFLLVPLLVLMALE
ncbi:DUF6868 family protein [Marilutibacter spongiae]|uniref:DUF6868 domain-containing protein n=1 Tax=Marilutibacter spongiae TaxID=2025720 RepID=A0A7W3TNR9_9GAMM|nr:hypothetical protein [Lysobacter spongiae]MBB1061464.1 hypothetical protein [Lysobacter spongiae]